MKSLFVSSLFFLIAASTQAETRYLRSTGSGCSYYKVAITPKDDGTLKFHNLGGAICEPFADARYEFLFDPRWAQEKWERPGYRSGAAPQLTAFGNKCI